MAASVTIDSNSKDLTTWPLAAFGWCYPDYGSLMMKRGETPLGFENLRWSENATENIPKTILYRIGRWNPHQNQLEWTYSRIVVATLSSSDAVRHGAVFHWMGVFETGVNGCTKNLDAKLDTK